MHDERLEVVAGRRQDEPARVRRKRIVQTRVRLEDDTLMRVIDDHLEPAEHVSAKVDAHLGHGERALGIARQRYERPLEIVRTNADRVDTCRHRVEHDPVDTVGERRASGGGHGRDDMPGEIVLGDERRGDDRAARACIECELSLDGRQPRD